MGPRLSGPTANVVDLMVLLPQNDHPHGLPEDKFLDLFTADTDVVFAFHGYPRAVHRQLDGTPTPIASMFAASTNKAPPQPLSTWLC